MRIGELKGNIWRLAIVLARRANQCDAGLLVWTGAKRSISCAPADSPAAERTLREAAALVVGTYALGARACDIHEDLELHRREMDE